MPFKALNHQRKEETGHSYTYSHTTKHLTLLTKSKRSQSALEYMMTYGWAILIIVIVAVILYSMGIFNPSSSVTFTSSGFAPFTVSSSLCNNLGYKIAVIAGPLPNNANSLTISKVFLTSATGANATTSSYTLTNPVTLKSGQSATILIPTVACNAANVHYSMSANIEYSYTVPTIGLQTINTTGTVAGTSIAGKPSVLTAYEPVTVTNSQSSSTPSPFQQMVNFTSLDSGWTSISTSNFGQNVEFFYYNGTVIPSWLESYTSSYAIWWLKIAAIPAGSSETVYVGFAPATTNLFNTVNDGEAPQLTCSNPSDTASCSTYAEYDNGANVFNNYWNFAGTVLPNGWYLIGTVSVVVSNGLIAPSGPGSGAAYNLSSSPLGILEIYNNQTSGETAGFSNVGLDNSSLGEGLLWMELNSQPTVISSAYLFPGSINPLTPYEPTNIYAVTGVHYKNSDVTWYYNDQAVQTYNSNTNQILRSIMIYNGGGSSGGDQISVKWVRVRAYPPNGVMPSVSFGSVA